MNQKSDIAFLTRNGINNMFDSHHFVPILKWKRAEQGALRELSADRKKYITPLVQFVMPMTKPNETLEKLIARFEEITLEISEKLIEVWGKDPIFIDVSLLFTTPLKAKSLETILRIGFEQQANFIPTIHLNDDETIKKVAFKLAKDTGSGFCLRLICPDFSDQAKFDNGLATLLSESGLEEKDIDLLIDIKETEENDDKYLRYLNLSQNIPQLSKWRTFIFAAGSFPEDLSKCKFAEENLIPRVDWISWKNSISDRKLKRKPSFADYTIQHPIYVESTQFYPPTTSIKYTLENEWLIMKGKKQKHELYLASAATLEKDERFYGEGFSSGDSYISTKAKHFPIYMKNPLVKGTGSTETWLKAGINHHISLVAHLIANLS
jgi:hypothetical protein